MKRSTPSGESGAPPRKRRRFANAPPPDAIQPVKEALNKSEDASLEELDYGYLATLPELEREQIIFEHTEKWEAQKARADAAADLKWRRQIESAQKKIQNNRQTRYYYILFFRIFYPCQKFANLRKIFF